MFRRYQPVRILAHLLVLVIAFAQISTAAAVVVDSVNKSSSRHEQHTQHSSSDKSDCLHMASLTEKAECCSSNECAEQACADKSCVTGASSSSTAVFMSQARIANRFYSKSCIEIHNQLQAGISSTSLFRPPR